jgi:hypothetical protein
MAIKNNYLFDLINDIKSSKKGTLFDDFSEYEQSFNSYMVCKFLSMNENLCPVVNSINHIQDVLEKEQIYKLLIELIPKTYSYDSLIRQSLPKYENESYVVNYYNCSSIEAREYIDIMGTEWAETIKKSYGGML